MITPWHGNAFRITGPVSLRDSKVYLNKKRYRGYESGTSWRSYDVSLMRKESQCHYGDVIMDAIASQITSLTIVYSIVYSDADQRKHQSSASLAFVRGIHRGPVNSPHKWPVTRKMFPFDDVIMVILQACGKSVEFGRGAHSIPNHANWIHMLTDFHWPLHVETPPWEPYMHCGPLCGWAAWT